MAVALEFIDFIVPISVIREKYPGGWEQCLEDHRNSLGGVVWHDDYLFRDGAMSPQSMKYIVDEWTAKGFQPFEEREGKKYWKDFCVVEGMFGGTTLECDWIELDDKGWSAWMKGTDPGEICGRDDKEDDE